MSPDLERRLREGREALPHPHATVTEQARKRALAAIRARRPRARVAGLVGLALILALALGAGLGALLAPSGTAASAPLGTGFLPESGWTVLQSGADATPERQALAVAANVPLHPEDSARGIRASSGLPYETLLRLPRTGVVIVALFSLREPYAWYDDDHPRRELPLRFGDATRSNLFNVPFRPDRPLGQYQLQATVNDHYVNLHLYFGTPTPSPGVIATAQEQLDRLVVGSLTASDLRARPAAGAVPSASRVIDRTLVCPIVSGGVREIDVSAQSGTRLFGDRSRWKFRPSVAFGDPRSQTPSMPHVGASALAGWPPTSEVGRPADPDSLSYSVRCRPAKGRVELSTAGLSGGPASPVGDHYDCVVPGKVLVRVRAVFRDPTSIRRERSRFVDHFVARGPVRESYLAVATLTGKRIALASAHESGRARMFVGDACQPSG